MPSVGGGGHGGGSHGGGGSFGGGGSHSYNGHPYRRGYYYGGMYVPLNPRARFGSMFGFPIVWLVFCVIIFGVLIFGMLHGTQSYSESTFEEYAFDQYEEIFPDNSNYEDNILVSILTYEDAASDGYDYISIVGDNVAYDINLEFGNSQTKFGALLERYMPRDYNTSSNFTEALVRTTNEMAQAIENMGLTSNLKKDYGANSNIGKVYLNATTVKALDTASVDAALASFKETTGLTLSYTITDYNDVMKASSHDILIIILFALVFIGIGVWMLIQNIRAYNKIKEAEANGTVNQYFRDEDGHSYHATDTSSKSSSETHTTGSGEWDINPDDFK